MTVGELTEATVESELARLMTVSLVVALDRLMVSVSMTSAGAELTTVLKFPEANDGTVPVNVNTEAPFLSPVIVYWSAERFE